MDEAEILCDRVCYHRFRKIISLVPDRLIDDLVATGFERPKEVKKPTSKMCSFILQVRNGATNSFFGALQQGAAHRSLRRTLVLQEP